MKVNLLFGLIQFEIGEDATMVGFIVAGIVAIIFSVAYFVSVDAINPARLNCIQYQMDRPNNNYTPNC